MILYNAFSGVNSERGSMIISSLNNSIIKRGSLLQSVYNYGQVAVLHIVPVFLG